MLYDLIVRMCAMDELDLFTRLGGIRKMAAIVGEAPSTVQSWKASGRIPAQKQPHVIERACAAGHDISADDVVFPLGKAEPTSNDSEAA